MMSNYKQKFGSILTIAFLITSGMVIILTNLIIQTSEGSSTCIDESDSDFDNGYFDDVTIVGNNNDAKLILNPNGTWEPKTADPWPRYFHAMAYDYTTHSVILFGGGKEFVENYDDTWIYDLNKNAWMGIQTENQPEEIKSHSMASIYGTGEVLLFGGNDELANFYNDTWIFHTNNYTWTKETTSTMPKYRTYTSMANIYQNDTVLLFGGFGGGSVGNLNDTWIYDRSNNTWTQKTPATSPSWRRKFGLAPFHNTDKVVLFGGNNHNGNPKYLNDTWIYDISANNWTKKTPATTPSPRETYGIASVYGDDKVVLYGGNDEFVGYDDTWVYDLSANVWTNKNPATDPGIKAASSMISINGTDKVMLFGGTEDDTGGLDETWIYDLGDNTWTQVGPVDKPMARDGHAMASFYDTDNAIVFGGYNYTDDRYLSDTWIYDYSANTWTKKSPAPEPEARLGHAMAPVYGTDNVVLFGGEDFEWDNVNDTWVYDLSLNTWTQKTPSTAPDPRVGHAMASIYGTQDVLLFGGDDGGDETWIYNFTSKTWTEHFPINYPTYREKHAMATLYGTDKVLLFGGNDGGNETWIFDLSDGNWTKITTIGEPDEREMHAMAAVPGTDNVILFGGTDGLDEFQDTWIYDVSEKTWAQKWDYLKPFGRSNHAMASVFDTDKVIMYGGYNDDKEMNFNDTWACQVAGFPLDGVYGSTIYSTSAQATFYTIDWNATNSTNTSIKIQFRSAITEAELAKQNFTGPDGNTTSFYTTSGQSIWSGHYGSRWFQYRIMFYTTNKNETPIVDNISISYNCWPETQLTFPGNDSIILDNTPNFLWSFIDLDSTQNAFQVLLDNNSDFSSIDYTSGIQTSANNSWQFPNGTGYTNISDGQWYWKVRTEDSDGTWSLNSSIRTFFLDSLAPNSQITTPVNNGVYQDLTTISGTANDPVNGSGLNKVELVIERLSDNKYWNGTAWNSTKPMLSVNGLDNWTYNTSLVPWSSGGQYKVQSRSTDNATNTELQPPAKQFLIDFSDPISKVTIPFNNSLLSSLTAISGTASDPGNSGIAKIEICLNRSSDDKYWDDSAWVSSKTWLSTTGTTVWSYDSSSVSWTTTHYVIQSKATDKINNIEIPSGATTFSFDFTKPSSTIVSPVNNAYLNGLETITGTASDIVGSVNFTEIMIKRANDNKYWSSSSSDWVSGETWLLTTGILNWAYDTSSITWTSGTLYTIRSKTTDKVLNIEVPGTGITIWLDLEIPNSTINQPINNSYLNSLDSISGTATDTGGSDLKNIEISIQQTIDSGYWTGTSWDSTETWLTVSGTTAWSYDTNQVTWSSGDKYTLRTKAMDNVNNTESPNNYVEFYFDNEPPSSEIEAPGNDIWLTEITAISGSASDTGGSEIALVDIYIKQTDNNKYWDSTVWTSKVTWLTVNGIETWSFDTNDVLWITDKEYQIQSHTIDNAGNSEPIGPGITFKLDFKPPENEIIINNNDEYTHSTEVELALIATDSGSGISVMSFSEDGIKWSGWEPFLKTVIFSLSSGDGEKKINFKVMDIAGNTAEPVFDSIILDTTPPEDLSIIINDNAEFTNSASVELALFATDSLSGIYEVSFSTDGETWEKWEPFNPNKLFTLPTNDGRKTVHFKVSDKAGNVAQTKDSIVLDTNSPYSLNMKINAGDEKTNSSTVIIDLAAMDDLSGVYQMSFSTDSITWTDWQSFNNKIDFTLPPGDGEKTIFYRVIDLVGNIADPISASILLDTGKGNAGQGNDTDNDGFNDDIDAFPNEPSQWLDTDGDNYGDNPNGKNPDAFPEDPNKWEKSGGEDKSSEKSSTEPENWIYAIIIIVIVVILILFFVMLKRKGKKSSEGQKIDANETVSKPEDIETTRVTETLPQPQQTPTQQTPTQPTPIQPTPTQQTPTQPTPTQPTPIQPTQITETQQ